MDKKMKRNLQFLIFSTLIIIGGFAFLLTPQAALAEVDCFLNPGNPACPPPIIPQCNTLDVTFRGTPIYKVTRICTVCDFFELVQRVINFIYIMTWPAATLMLIYGGFLMIIPTAGGEKTVQQFNKGKKVITNTIVGIVIVFLAWIFIDTIIKVGANQSVQTGGIGKLFINQKPLPWNEVKCAASFPGQTPPTPPPPPPPIGQLGSIWYCKRGGVCSCAQDNPDNPVPGSDYFFCDTVQGQVCTAPGPMTCPPKAALFELIKMVGSGRIQLSRSGSCSDASGTLVHAATTYTQMTSGAQPTVCHNGCTPASRSCVQKNITINQNLIRALVAAGVVHSFIISSLTTGSHSVNSLHYTGDAVDLAKPGSNSVYLLLESFFKDPVNRTRFSITKVLCETATTVYTSCASVPVSQRITHLHIEFSR